MQLFFPVLHGKHWFLFVVDLKHKLFIILDSYFSRSDSFCVYTRNKMVSSMVSNWDFFLYVIVVVFFVFCVTCLLPIIFFDCFFIHRRTAFAMHGLCLLDLTQGSITSALVMLKFQNKQTSNVFFSPLLYIFPIFTVFFDIAFL